MKNIITLFLCLFCVNISLAQEELSLGERAKNQRAALIQHQDELLEMLLQVPFELRQYIFPVFYENKETPKKIQMHPDILVWKGKRPTRIAKRFQNDQELLEFLPAQFYYFLAPEMWTDNDVPALEKNVHQLFINLMKEDQLTDSMMNPEKLIQLKNSLNLTYDSLSNEQKNALKTSSNIRLSEMLIFAPSQLTENLKKQGYESVQSFAQSVDRIADTYRQYKKGKIPPISQERELVRNYFSLLPFIFEKSGFGVLLKDNIGAN